MTVISYKLDSHKSLFKQCRHAARWSNVPKCTGRKNNVRRMLNRSSNFLRGRVSTSLLIALPLLALIVTSILMVPNLVALDYSITDLKANVKKLDEGNALLREKIANSIGSEQIEAWAKQNGFVKVDGVSYLELTDNNLAQVHVVQQ